MLQRSSMLAELAWLAYFLIIFVVLVYAFNVFVVPHHFNDRIAVMISAVLAALTMIGTRAKFMQRSR